MTAFDLEDPREIPAYTLGEAARYLAVSKSTLRAWFAGQHYAYHGERRMFERVIKPADPNAPLGNVGMKDTGAILAIG